MESLFMTITNANFDKERFVQRIREAIALRNELLAAAPTAKIDCDCMTWSANSVEEMEAKAAAVGVLSTENEDIRSLQQLLTYGLKEMAAYAEHAVNLGFDDDEIHAFMQEALVATTQNLSAEELTALVLKCGEFGEWLFIRRNGFVDLPKGKFEAGETPEQAALREVQEETGLHNVVINDFLCSTWHCYAYKGGFALKQTYWFSMFAPKEQELTPQLEEGICEIMWFDKQAISAQMPAMYASVKDVAKSLME